jgi:hypothetical protein
MNGVESLRDWLKSNRNPYFRAVIIAYIVLNRTTIFGMLNFTSAIPFADRLVWVRDRFALHEVNVGFLTIKGWFAVTVESLFWGFIVMAIINLMDAAGSYVFAFVNRLAIQIKKRAGIKFVPATLLAASLKKLEDMKTEVDLVRSERATWEGQINNQRSEIENDKITIQTLSNDLSKFRTSAQDYQKQLSDISAKYEAQQVELSDEIPIYQSAAAFFNAIWNIDYVGAENKYSGQFAVDDNQNVLTRIPELKQYRVEKFVQNGRRVFFEFVPTSTGEVFLNKLVMVNKTTLIGWIGNAHVEYRRRDKKGLIITNIE